MALSAADIARALAALSEEFERRGERAKMLVVGDAAVVLLFQARELTGPIAAHFVHPTTPTAHSAAEAVATRLNLPPDWLEDASNTHLIGATLGAVLYHSDHLEVRCPAMPQLLAMTLTTWRDAVDRNDAVRLLSEMEGSAAGIWEMVGPYVPEDRRDGASRAFDEVWEEIHGR